MTSSDNNQRPSGGVDHSDLDWIAFQYISGELPADVCAEFEARLADDQVARDAVVRAVGLTQSLADVLAGSDVGQTSVTRDSRTVAPRRHTHRWVVLASVACFALALIAVPRGIEWLMNATANGENGSSSEMHDLALAWASSRDEVAIDARDVDVEPAVVPAPMLTADVAEIADEIETPSWMLLAVASVMESTDTAESAVE